MQYQIILVMMIFDNLNQLLLIKRNREPGKDLWSLPGGTGALENEPNPFKAVAVEVQSDFSVKYIKHHLLTVIFVDQPTPALRLYFYGKVNGSPKIRSKKTIQEFKWFNIDDALKLKLAFQETDRNAIKLFAKNLSSRSLSH